VHQVMIPTGNRLLHHLSPSDLSQLKPLFKEVRLETGAILHHPASPIEHVYFPTSGLVSLLAIMQTGQEKLVRSSRCKSGPSKE